MIRESAGNEQASSALDSVTYSGGSSPRDFKLGKGSATPPTEQSTLLPQKAVYRSDKSSKYGSVQDLESLKAMKSSKSSTIPYLQQFTAKPFRSVSTIIDWKKLNVEIILRTFVREPANCLPSVILGLLLNVLDALSYGMILFPLSQPPFTDLGPDGVSMFYISCIVSQLVYSCGGSIFRGGVGSEMVCFALTPSTDPLTRLRSK